jgi:hypothetical protein
LKQTVIHFSSPLKKYFSLRFGVPVFVILRGTTNSLIIFLFFIGGEKLRSLKRGGTKEVVSSWEINRERFFFCFRLGYKHQISFDCKFRTGLGMHFNCLCFLRSVPFSLGLQVNNQIEQVHGTLHLTRCHQCQVPQGPVCSTPC